MKYTKEIMQKACENALSIAQVCRNLGIKPIGGNYNTVKRNLEKFGIDTSYFTGQRWNKGLHNVERTALTKLEDVLQDNTKYSSSTLRNRLINAGLKECKCELCGYTENLELHHIDGNHYNNKLENLQILCPNCHSKTDNYRGRNSNKNTTPLQVKRKNSKSHYCICKNCGKEFYSDRIDRAKKFCCRECYNDYLKKMQMDKQENMFSIESLQEQINKCVSIQQIADNLNSTRPTIRKYLIKYDLYDTFKLKYDFHAKTVIQYDINGNKLKEFPSMQDAADSVGLIGVSGIAKCCMQKRRSAGGYVWRYKDFDS